MMKQLQQPSQGNHPIETVLTDLSRELRDLLLQVGNLHKLIVQQLRTAQDEQVKTQLSDIRNLLQQHLSGMTIRKLYDTVTIILLNAGRKLLNEITNYKKLMGNRGEENIKTKAEAAKKTIEDMVKVFEKAITDLKGTVEKLKKGASTLTQELQNRQSSAQKQEIASAIQQATSAIGDISNRINSIVQKLGDLENILAQIQQEVNQLMGQGEQPTAPAGASHEGSADGTTSTSSEQDLPTQLDELEKKIVGLYQAVVTLEKVVNTATSAASIIPPTIEGVNTASLAAKFTAIKPKDFYRNITAIGQYTGLKLPDLFAKLNPPEQQEQGNATQPHFLKQQAVSSTDIPESIKSYLEEVKAFLLGARNQMEVNLNNILEELSKLEDKIGQISDINIKGKVQKVYSIPTFVILDECKRKLNEDVPPSRIETIAPIVGTILIAATFWDSFQNWNMVYTAMNTLQKVAERFQDPATQTALSNILGTASHRLKQSKPHLQEAPVPTDTAAKVGATVLAAIGSKFVQSPEEARAALKTQGQSQQQEGPKELRVFTDPFVIEKITNTVGKEGVIPRLEDVQDPRVGGGVVRNIKRMINAFAEYMTESWEDITDEIQKDIREGRLSDPQQKIQRALNEIDDAWETLLNRMQATEWKEYFRGIAQEKIKIEGIKGELERLIDACFELLEAWKAGKPTEGALDIEALLFHPLGLPALKAALRTLPPSIPGSAIARREAQKRRERTTEASTRGVGNQVARKKEETQTKEVAQKKDETQTGAPKRLRYRPRRRADRLAGTVKRGNGPIPTHSAEDKETTEKTLQEEIRRAINSIRERQVDDAIKAVANARMILRNIGSQKPQPRGKPPAHLREAEAYLGAALQNLRDAIRLGPHSDGFKADLQQASSFLQHALNVLSNQTVGGTPYLGRNLLLLMKTLRSIPTTAQSHRQRAKNEAILEKETI